MIWTVAALAAVALGWAACALSPSGALGLALAAWYVVLSGVAAVAWARDKSAARRAARRTPERRLLALALAGGFPGAWLAARAVRHKTKKRSFLWAFRWRVLAHLVVCGGAVGGALWLG